jgi:hypothetical protein
MSQIRPDEVSSILKDQISGFFKKDPGKILREKIAAIKKNKLIS